MDKHHKSEIKLSDMGKYNVKCGTINKNNPEVLYIRTKIKVKPSDKKTTYFNEIIGIKNKFVRNVKSIIVNDDTISNDYIFHFDANEKGMVYNKNSYIKYDIYIKPVVVKKFLDYRTDMTVLANKLNDNLSALLKETCLIHA